jgi:hypothetical protein
VRVAKVLEPSLASGDIQCLVVGNGEFSLDPFGQALDAINSRRRNGSVMHNGSPIFRGVTRLHRALGPKKSNRHAVFSFAKTGSRRLPNAEDKHTRRERITKMTGREKCNIFGPLREFVQVTLLPIGR